ncbi:hypothetical protein [Yoonia sp. 2307UL14-13]|uniref:hypothetical protein n=1 Tax=Yoonia sp. 2307UL14-13 TaxID=3126506 RepID=UPI0030A3ECCB
MKRITALTLALSMAASSGFAQGAEPQQPVGSAEIGAGGLASGPAIAALAGLLIIVAVASGSDDDSGSSTGTTN